MKFSKQLLIKHKSLQSSVAKKKFLITSALPYANGSLHLGHMVEYIQTDIWVRFQKMRGHQCLYVCGDDAHGTPIMLKAEAQDMQPEELITAFKAEHERECRGNQGSSGRIKKAECNS